MMLHPAHDSFTSGQSFKHSTIVNTDTSIPLQPCGQSYKQFTLIIYESRVVIWGIFKSGTTLES